VAILNLMPVPQEANGAVLGGGEKRSQVVDLELRLLRAHSADVEDELSA